MISKPDLELWKKHAPWKNLSQVEQDLLLSRVIVEIYQIKGLADRLAFRGGTAMHKIHLAPAARYSEDIDLVQIESEPIGKTSWLLREALDSWLGKPNFRKKEGRIVFKYKVGSTDDPSKKLTIKIEINSREHFSELGFIDLPYSVDNPWFSGEAMVRTYKLEELLATKLRALYQRRKGRDLFDMWYALNQGSVDMDAMMRCFDRYMREGGHSITRKLFIENLQEKLKNKVFQDDANSLMQGSSSWNFEKAMEFVLENVISRIPE